ncbi:MAG: type II toxin-antitoxin system HigB family toxin [Bacteroidetes bacterium]|nr:type II toxin-antitoxin system HigB family toxin [Bacteroidota bacterium]
MKAHLIKKQTVEDYVKTNVQSRVPFEIWFSVIRRIEWNEPNDIISTFNSADILGNGSERVVFNIGGNKYRMICRYHFGNNRVHLFVKWIGTHAQYTKLCNEKKQYDVRAF